MMTQKKLNRIASIIGFGGMFLLLWMNGAVGIIGNENEPANYLYMILLLAIILGALLSRLRPMGMFRTFLSAAIIQFIIPFVAWIIWPDINWGNAGFGGVIIINIFFSVIFVFSALFFYRASYQS